jgi:hypothetical protein
VHDAVAGLDHVHILERLLGPIDEVETVLVATIFHRTVLFNGVFIEARVLNGQRVVDDQLRRDYRVDLRRVSPSFRNGITQSGKVDQAV